MSTEFLKARIAATEAMILVYEDAMLALGSGAIQSYTLDTGQNRQTVTKSNLTEMRNVVDSLYSRLAMLEKRCFGSVLTVAPAW